jgi:hypothetical protein
MARKPNDSGTADVVEEQPVRGGSYTRDPDTGVLTQVEGHGFAEQPATLPGDAPASSSSPVQE